MYTPNCVQVRKRELMYMHTHAQVCVLCMYMYVCMYAWMHVCIYEHAYVHTHSSCSSNHLVSQEICTYICAHTTTLIYISIRRNAVWMPNKVQGKYTYTHAHTHKHLHAFSQEKRRLDAQQSSTKYTHTHAHTLKHIYTHFHQEKTQFGCPTKFNENIHIPIFTGENAVWMPNKIQRPLGSSGSRADKGR